MNLNSIQFKNLNTKIQINIKIYKLNWIPIDIDWNYMQLICLHFENIHLNGTILFFHHHHNIRANHLNID
jgi:hypothetical protein